MSNGFWGIPIRSIQSLVATNSVFFNYTGIPAEFFVPQGVTQIEVLAWGGGWFGGSVYAVFDVTPEEVLTVKVGGAATDRMGAWPDGGDGGYWLSFPQYYGMGGCGSTSLMRGLEGTMLVAGGEGGHGHVNHPSGYRTARVQPDVELGPYGPNNSYVIQRRHTSSLGGVGGIGATSGNGAVIDDYAFSWFYFSFWSEDDPAIFDRPNGMSSYNITWQQADENNGLGGSQVSGGRGGVLDIHGNPSYIHPIQDPADYIISHGQDGQQFQGGAGCIHDLPEWPMYDWDGVPQDNGHSDGPFQGGSGGGGGGWYGGGGGGMYWNFGASTIDNYPRGGGGGSCFVEPTAVSAGTTYHFDMRPNHNSRYDPIDCVWPEPGTVLDENFSFENKFFGVPIISNQDHWIEHRYQYDWNDGTTSHYRYWTPQSKLNPLDSRYFSRAVFWNNNGTVEEPYVGDDSCEITVIGPPIPPGSNGMMAIRYAIPAE
jgi:hypothetical protein